MVRGLSKHQSAFLFDCCVFIARFALLSCYSSAKTRIRLVKSYQSDLLSGVPPRHLQTSGWTHHKGRINHKISHLMCLFMVGPILMDLLTPHPCPSLILMTYWGEPSFYLWMRMGRERGLPFLNMSRISIYNKSPEKISSDSSSRLMEINLMTSFHITNSWNT